MSDFLDLQGAKNLNTDAIHISAVANSVDPVTGAAIDTHVNRAGGTDYTLHGFWNALGPVVMPWTSVTGGTLTQPNQAFLHPANGNYYSWTGAYPAGGYAVAPGTDPTAVTGYVPRADLTLRAELNIIIKRVNDVAEMVADNTLEIGQLIETTSYFSFFVSTLHGNRGGNTYVIAASGTGIEDGGSVINLANGLQAIGLFPSGKISPCHFGAVASDGNDHSIAFSSALAYSKSIYVENGTWNISNVSTTRDAIINCEGRGVVFKKSANGYIFSLKARSIIDGGPCFDGSYYDLGFTGNSLVFDDGTHTADITAQGHQYVCGAVFYNSDSYHVLYTPTMGWMSELLSCSFNQNPANADAAVLWPDEPTTGGNRHIIGCYSVGPIVNTGSADNGLIDGNEIGSASSGLNEQGIIFPAGKNPRKIRVVNNRIAISNGTFIIRGGENVFSNNITAGNVVIDAGAIDCVYDETNIQIGSFTDNSGAKNKIYMNVPVFYTPTIKAGISLGNGSIQGEYERRGHYIDFRFEVAIGSTTVVSATMVFNLPVPVLAGSRTFLGQAIASGYVGISSVSQSTSDVRVYNATSVATWNATVPKAWVAGDVIVVQGTYRIG